MRAVIVHVLIVGAGFAGVRCAQRLASKRGVRVTLIDKHNYQQFQPLLYQVATGILSPDDAAFNLRDVFLKNHGVTVVMAEVRSVDLNARMVTATTGEMYCGDVVVLAAGAEVNFFGIPGSEQFTFPMYSLQDAERLRSRLLELFEEADAAGVSGRPTDLHILVVGGGSTGVETAGAIADIVRRFPRQLFPFVNFDMVGVSLVDAGNRVLPPFSPTSQEYAASVLRERGVHLRLGVSVLEMTRRDALLSDGTRVQADLIVWAGGIQASALSLSLGIEPGHGGRVDIAPDLTLIGFPKIYALGDFANTTGKDGEKLPQLASVAQQAGRHCADNIIADVAGRTRKPFAYVDRGIMAMVGRNAAVAEIWADRRPITGALAFFAWLAVHAVLMTSVRSRIATLFEWAWEYFGSVRLNPILDRPSEESVGFEQGGVYVSTTGLIKPKQPS